MKSFCKRMISFLSWVLLIIPMVLILVFAAARLRGEAPELFGYSLYVIVTPSMTPELEVGDIILTREYDRSTVLNIGDVITYKGFAGNMDGKLITHRITDLEEKEGVLTITAKGTANPSPDPQFTSDRVVSVMKQRLPVIGRVYSAVQKPWGFVLFFAVPMLWFIASEIKELKQNIKNEIVSSENTGENNE